MRRDHPRVCGEKGFGEDDYTRREGSPPRMRGKVGWSAERSGPEGITPAYAGKRSGLSGLALSDGDHPRVCGEKPVAMHTRMTSAGSPPRMRGKAASACLTSFQTGITPAYAGKSTRPCSSIVQYGDHPRVCGEKKAGLMKVQLTGGSPPRMRGKAALSASAAGSEGITPAYAGKSPCRKSAKPAGGDHPRVCGEKTKKIP